MASADSCPFSATPGDGYQLYWRIAQASPDKNGLFPLMHPPQFTATALGDFGLRCV
ncbi:hypothetical protein GCM10025858_23370 [Alicyclobacillus sacchari]|nr:hypothetical protein GCM10025858_23370 [Alicyclobacillus sacchari]